MQLQFQNMSELCVLVLVLGSVYWILCSLVVYRASDPIGVHGNGAKIKRDGLDWFLIVVGPLVVTAYTFYTAIVLAAKLVLGTKRNDSNSKTCQKQ